MGIYRRTNDQVGNVFRSQQAFRFQYGIIKGVAPGHAGLGIDIGFHRDGRIGNRVIMCHLVDEAGIQHGVEHCGGTRLGGLQIDRGVQP